MSNQNIPGDPVESGPYDFSVPQSLASAGTARSIWQGSYVSIYCRGQKRLVTSQELQQLLDNGEDVEVRTPGT
jgi:hypothetical protein